MVTNQARLDFINSISGDPKPPAVSFYTQNGLYVHHGIYKIGHSVAGTDGFGYEWNGKRLVKFPHHGDVKIGKDVEIGAFTCIDRATLEGEATVIGEGTKIDNLVHIAHNVKIGKHCLIVAGSVIGGGVIMGDRVYVGIGAMIKNKVKIGNDVTIGMGAVVLQDIPDGWTVIGNPAKRLEK